MDSNYLQDLKTKVIDNGLCSGCGTCAGVCPKGCISFQTEDSYLPLLDNTECIDCGLCFQSCPGKGFAFENLKAGAQHWDDRIGPYIDFIYSHATDETLRKNGASGGTVSAIFKYLLEQKLVDKVVCVKTEEEQFRVHLTDDVETLKTTQGSKYIPVPLNTALKEILNNKYRVAVVGTPCELQGVENAAKYLPKLKELIRYKIGLFCGFSQPKECLSALRKYLHTEGPDWRFDGWRCGKYPGYVRFTNAKTGEQKQCLIYDALNIAVPFYSMEKCFHCPDGTNMCADLSLGDIHSRGDNQNCGIIRTQNGATLIASMVRDGYLKIQPLTLDEAMKSTVGSVAYMKGFRSSLYNKTSKKAAPSYDISFGADGYNKATVLQNRAQLALYRFARKRRITKFFEKHPKLQMRMGRYIYTFPNRATAYKSLKALKKLVKRK